MELVTSRVRLQVQGDRRSAADVGWRERAVGFLEGIYLPWQKERMHVV